MRKKHLLIALLIVLVTTEACSKLTCPTNTGNYEPKYRTAKMKV